MLFGHLEMNIIENHYGMNNSDYQNSIPYNEGYENYCGLQMDNPYNVGSLAWALFEIGGDVAYEDD